MNCQPLLNQLNKNTIFDDYLEAVEVIRILDKECNELAEQSVGYKLAAEDEIIINQELTTVVEQQKQIIDTLRDKLDDYQNNIKNTTPLRDFLKKQGNRIDENRKNELKEKYKKYLGGGKHINLNDYI